MPGRQGGFQLQQLRVSGGLVWASVNALIQGAGVREPALPLQGGVHPAAVLAVPVNDVGLVCPIWVALQPLSVLNVENGAHPLPECGSMTPWSGCGGGGGGAGGGEGQKGRGHMKERGGGMVTAPILSRADAHLGAVRMVCDL